MVYFIQIFFIVFDWPKLSPLNWLHFYNNLQEFIKTFNLLVSHGFKGKQIDSFFFNQLMSRIFISEIYTFRWPSVLSFPSVQAHNFIRSLLDAQSAKAACQCSTHFLQWKTVGVQKLKLIGKVLSYAEPFHRFLLELRQYKNGLASGKNMFILKLPPFSPHLHGKG